MLDIIYIKDLINIFPYKKISSVKNWLSKNGVQVFGDKNCKRQFVLAVQFKRAQLQEKINHLKEKYGDNWIEVLKSEMSLCSKYQSALDAIQNNTSNSSNVPRTKTRGEVEKQFAIDLRNALEVTSRCPK